MTAASQETETAQEVPYAGTDEIDGTDGTYGMTHRPACNGGVELSSRAVSIARRSANHMVAQGYMWEWEFDTYISKGTTGVRAPTGKGYEVWLPDVYPNYPEGRCSCRYFAKHLVCKHIYYVVEEFAVFRVTAPGMVEVEDEEWAKAADAKRAQSRLFAPPASPAPCGPVLAP